MAEATLDNAVKKIATDVESGKLTLPSSLKSGADRYRQTLSECSAIVDTANPSATAGNSSPAATPEVQRFIESGHKSCAAVSQAVLVSSLGTSIRKGLASGDKDVESLVQKYTTK